ncbi:MAG: hypothetical protein K6G71_01765 [Clostridiales bacterium]|nr:hypothetical protein [Clostridiales bacterium]
MNEEIEAAEVARVETEQKMIYMFLLMIKESKKLEELKEKVKALIAKYDEKTSDDEFDMADVRDIIKAINTREILALIGGCRDLKEAVGKVGALLAEQEKALCLEGSLPIC